MKKLLSLALALVLMGCASALADIEVWDVTDGSATLVAGTNVNYGSTSGSANPGEGKVVVDMPNALEQLGYTDYQVKIYTLDMPTHMYNGSVQVSSYNTDCDFSFFDIASSNIYFPAADDSLDGAEITYEVVVTYTGDNLPVMIETTKFYMNATDLDDLLFSGRAWYPNNNAQTFGPQVNGSWKTYSVVDLSVQGTQTLKLISAGGWYIGNVTVTVTGDQVVVDYLMNDDVITTDVHDETNVDSEYLNFYADAASIDMAAESNFAFGVPFSIANDLAGDTTVCLFANLQVDVATHCPFVYRFWPNMPQNKLIVAEMEALLAK